MVKKSILACLLIVLTATGLGGCNSLPALTSELPSTTLTIVTTTANSIAPTVVLATGLEVPWSLDFLPDGSIIFTERPGRVRLIQAGGGLLPEPLLTVPNISARGEGGLLGIAVHPKFTENHYVYLYFTHDQAGGAVNQVVRCILEGNVLREDKALIAEIPAGINHNGGRIKFGPDGLLYITTGDAGDANAAQETDALNGKILRINDDGTIPADNTFPNSPVYSYGHRNPEGLAWDSQGRLWATEHGSSATDELNLIEKSQNYGWPEIRGDATRQGMVTPVINSAEDTWAPSGTAFYNGIIYFTGLRGASLYQAVISAKPPTLSRYLTAAYGRLRDVVVGPDGLFYILTSNRDGRGSPVAEDDRMIRVDPRGLK